MGWKQPIDMDIEKYCLGNKFATTIFILLLLRAKNKDGCIYHHGTNILLKRGQCICGRHELANRCGLEKTQSGKVQRILDFLQKTVNLIDKRKSQNCTIITILNYDELVRLDNETDKRQTNDRQTTDTNKSVKSKESVESDEKHPPTLKELFIDKDFSLDELLYKQSFIDYWTEKNPTGKKERWQMEKVFDVKRRFKTWLRNEKKWNKSEKQTFSNPNKPKEFDIQPMDKKTPQTHEKLQELKKELFNNI